MLLGVGDRQRGAEAVADQHGLIELSAGDERVERGLGVRHRLARLGGAAVETGQRDDVDDMVGHELARGSLYFGELLKGFA